MKSVISFFIIGLLINLFFNSCDSDEDTISINSGFSIEFSDGTIIYEKDIFFYDSSTCILFLKDDIYFSYRENESGHILTNEFTVFVDDDTIYQGIMYPYDYAMAAGPSMPFYIYRDINNFDNSILQIQFLGYSNDFRNDPRIIMALEKSNLLNHGISFTIDSVNVIPNDNFSYKVSCVITIKNHDLINYYVLDPKKMGESYFSYYNGGLIFYNKETDYSYYLEGIYHSEWGSITIDDFSILKGGSEITYAFSSTDYRQIYSGLYKCSFSLKYKGSNFNLDRGDSRIWIGEVYSSVDNIVVELK